MQAGSGGMRGEDLGGCVREALVKRSRLRLSTVGDDDRLAGDLGFDSFALLQVVLDLEERLGIEIDPSRLAGLREMTVRQLVDLVEAQRGSGRGLAPDGDPSE